MRANFEQSLELVLAHEGGYVDHPKDPGGATNMGITRRTLSAYKGRSVSKDEVRNLSRATAAAIYRRDYWDRSRCNDLPAGLDYLVFDGSVNSGVSRSVKWMQYVVGAKQDGIVGSNTLAAIAKYPGPVTEIIERIGEVRMAFLRRLKTWKTFGRGWTRRVVGNQPGAQVYDIGAVDRATAMYKRNYVAPPVIADDGSNARATEEDIRVTSIVSDAVRDPAAIGTAGSVVTGALAAGTGDGPLAYAIAGVLVLVAVAGVIMFLRRA